MITDFLHFLAFLYADHHGWWTKVELQPKLKVHREHVIRKMLHGKAILPRLAQIVSILLTIVMYVYLLKRKFIFFFLIIF